MDTEKKLRVVNLSCVRQNKPLFVNLSFQLTPHAVLLIEGKNGSGKSSLLRLLAGLSTPSSGEIFWQEKNIHDARIEYSRQLHYIGHSNGIKLGLTVTENLRLTSHLHLIDSSNEFEDMLLRLQLSAHKNTPACYLSAGQKRRLALAKLFLFQKTLWIADEPLTALDSDTQAFFMSQLDAHLQRGGMAVISSHHPMPFNHPAQTLRLASC